MGGETLLREAGTLQWPYDASEDPVTLAEVFVVELEMLPAGVVALLGIADIRALGISLDATMTNPDRDWEQAVPLSIFGRLRQCTRLFRSPPGNRNRAQNQHFETDFLPAQPAPQHARYDEPELPRSRHEVGGPAPQRTPEFDSEGRVLLSATKRQNSAEQGRWTANRIAQLFQEEQARKHALKVAKAGSSSAPKSSGPDMNGFGSLLTNRNFHRHESSSMETRKRSNFYAVRKGRNIGIYETWEECERQTKGYPSEFKRFDTLEEAKAYITGRRLNFMVVRKTSKPDSSFVGGQALRALIDVWQDGHADSLRLECGLDTMSDVNLTVAELLHEVHDFVVDRVDGCAGRVSFAREGTLKILYEGERGRVSPSPCCFAFAAPSLVRRAARYLD
jgi:hypothetical protein